MEDKLKVSDLVDLKESDYKNTLGTINELQKLSFEYHNMSDFYDPNQLEIIKRKFDSYMQTFAVQYAKIKKFKGSQHVYLDEVRKRIKAEALEILMEEGVKVTAADSLVYKSKYYTERIRLMEDVKEFMIKTEILYERFDTTFQAIVSSLYSSSKEKENTNK